MSKTSRPSRRNVIDAALTSGVGLLLPNSLHGAATGGDPLLKVAGMPDVVAVFTEAGRTELSRNGAAWQKQDIEVGTAVAGDGLSIKLRSPKSAVLHVQVRWLLAPGTNLQYLGDHWERSYGDLAWRSMEPERVMPWYFLASDGTSTTGCGVKTGPAALCFWQIDPMGVSLWLDVRNGGNGVKLGDRELLAATVVAESYRETTPFTAACRFCRRLCSAPRLPKAPVYGGNNWYYAYGKSSAQDIRDDSERIASFATSRGNKPFMVIDDGWQPNPTAGPWSTGNSKFPDMAALAADMKRIGVQPGIWVRPLFTKEQTPEAWHLKSPNASREYANRQAVTLDPTVPDVLEKVARDIQTVEKWGYGLIKHDFSTYDLMGRWGFAMNAAVTDPHWHFSNEAVTNAEIITALYRTIRKAAGDALVLGCNTVGHLSAGYFELQRTGDDTSGRDWNRTRKMGVNTLAFRAAQHNTFFALDADCVGLTRQIPWTLNRQWLDLLARSGTALFVSAAPDAVGADERKALRKAFAVAAEVQPVAEPLDWFRNNEPRRWKLGGKTTEYDWFGSDGVSAFGE